MSWKRENADAFARLAKVQYGSAVHYSVDGPTEALQLRNLDDKIIATVPLESDLSPSSIKWEEGVKYDANATPAGGWNPNAWQQPFPTTNTTESQQTVEDDSSSVGTGTPTPQGDTETPADEADAPATPDDASVGADPDATAGKSSDASKPTPDANGDNSKTNDSKKNLN